MIEYSYDSQKDDLKTTHTFKSKEKTQVKAMLEISLNVNVQEGHIE